MEQLLDEPRISRTLRTGYPIILRPMPLKCAICGESVPDATAYGVGDVGIVCKDCADYLDEEFKSLMFTEKLKALGYEVKYNG